MIDTSMYRVQVPDFAGGITQGLSQGMALRDAMDKRALAQKQLAEQEQIKKAHAAGMQIGDDGQVNFDPNRTVGALAKAGLGQQAYEFQTQHQQQDMQRRKHDLDLSTQQLQKQLQEIDVSSRVLGAANDQPSWERSLVELESMGLSTQGLPRAFDPGFRNNLLYRSMSAKDQLAHQLSQRELGIKEREAQAKLSGGVGRPLTKFEQAAEQERGKAYGQVQAGAVKAQEQLSLIDDTIKALDDYSNKTVFGTGLAAKTKNWFGSLAPETQNLEAKFRMINLKNMTQTFAGMSRAIDTEVERAAWESTQPSLGNDDNVNKKILLGSKAIALKAKAEADAQKQWVEGMGRGTLQGYDSPILGKTSAMVAPNGEMILVPKGAEDDYREAGYKGIDEYARGRQSKMEIAPMRRKTNQIDWMD